MKTAPAPWQLTGRGYLAALRFPNGSLDADPFTPAGLKGERQPGNIGYIMLVDYSSSAVGPYYELLFIPGRFRGQSQHKRYSISRIFVSSQSSVDNGQRNWGIPKELADFDLQYDHKGGVVATISQQGKAICRLSFAKQSWSLPVTTALVPAALRTLCQHWQDQYFEYTPAARGRAALANLQSAWADSSAFADLASAKPLLAVAVPRFQMTFPVANVAPLLTPNAA
ncbi:MAG: acetoacetate decarboxylase family protein [Gammaproteobacteria bacterium]|nr:acetoacetate decarboxylase family protein [Gammaproteobacteria bacterium]